MRIRFHESQGHGILTSGEATLAVALVDTVGPGDGVTDALGVTVEGDGDEDFPRNVDGNPASGDAAPV